ncbi:metallophosphoesterase family protein [uncultured Sphingomonas sp.]|uniref:metallophosphoesterase family protein n=1 Tax=uncultured Sphingomonas sp. TaxID=158754 RepID=UPI0025EDC97F|nr:metallophosphoesterase family protein [uncultured Sphingomonas sp.]
MFPAPALPPGQRVYAIGDVHGRLDLLDALVAKIRSDNAERPGGEVTIILLGDIIDRGPSSAEIVQQCMDFTKRSAAFVVLKGNHEAMMVRAYRGDFGALGAWVDHGGDATLQSWGVPTDMIADAYPALLLAEMRRHVPRSAIDWMDRLPLSYRSGSYFFVHAGIKPGVPLARQRERDMLWIKEAFTDDVSLHPMMIVHGHSVRIEGPELLHNRIGLDTGAYRSDILSALGLEGSRRWIIQTGDQLRMADHASESESVS